MGPGPIVASNQHVSVQIFCYSKLGARWDPDRYRTWRRGSHSDGGGPHRSCQQPDEGALRQLGRGRGSSGWPPRSASAPATESSNGINSGERKGRKARVMCRRLRRIPHPMRMVGWGVVPDQQLGHLRPHRPQRLHRHHHIVGAAAARAPSSPVRRAHLQRPEDGAPVILATDEHDGRRPTSAPAGAQGRELAQGRLIGHPDLAAARPASPGRPRSRPPFFGVGRIGTSQHVARPFPAIAQPMQGPAHRPLARPRSRPAASSVRNSGTVQPVA